MPTYHPDQLAKLERQLRQHGFGGDFEASLDSRIAAATDNSIYQLLPDAVLYPRTPGDVETLVSVTRTFDPHISITARGGATGTNGQSLNQGLVVDTSRWLRNIVSLDRDARRVTVEPGVTLDELNRFLAKHDLFFPPDVSSGSRATIGGMVATDASGKGSRIWGKTSAYLQSIEMVLADGDPITLREFPIDELERLAAGSTTHRRLLDVYRLLEANRDVIEEGYPALERALTGYNIRQAIARPGFFNPLYLFSGAEGTLGIANQITLRVVPKPRHKALIVVLYDDFLSGLDHVAMLLQAGPAAVEVLDDKILGMARRDAVWQQAKQAFAAFSDYEKIAGLSFVELVADSEVELDQQCRAVVDLIDESMAAYGVIGSLIEKQETNIAGLWAIRRRAVGLLGACVTETGRRPLAFVEDTAVPPQHLGSYIRDFRNLLDRHGLQYGMYGHAGVGCLHVRPGLNLRQPDDRALIRTISDEVVALVKRYHGVFWGEHGKGFRGEYLPQFLVPEIAPLVNKVKQILDPENRLNPGKIATTPPQTIKRIDEVAMRGEFDAQINAPDSAMFASAIACNGNALCQNRDPATPLCPSYKVIADKRHSPKGRAAMLREWLRRRSPTSGNQMVSTDELEQQLYQSLRLCLSCQSCTNSCPLTVDIPEMKSRFFDTYHRHAPRLPSDRIFAAAESFAALGRRTPTAANLLLQNPLMRTALKKWGGVIDLPRFSRRLKTLRKNNGAIIPIDKNKIPASLIDEKTVVLLPDTFNMSYDNGVIGAACKLLTAADWRVLLAPALNNGKALHVCGFRDRFNAVARRHIEIIERWAESGLPLLGLDMATRQMHRNEYQKINGSSPRYDVIAIEKWLQTNLALGHLRLPLKQLPAKTLQLFPHCMEQSADLDAIEAWRKIFNRYGVKLKIETAGCCGMSGLFGHETEHAALSQQIFAQNWAPRIQASSTLLASGFSCRSQLRRAGYSVLHPLQWLAAQLP